MIDKSKEYDTRDGREARIYATDGSDPYPVHGAVKGKDGWFTCYWDEVGHTNPCYFSDLDLIEKPKKVVRYLHIRKNGTVCLLLRPVKNDSDRYASIKRIEVEYKEGEYDE